MTETQEAFDKLKETYGEVLTTTEATAKYDFRAFGAPLVSVQRKSDNVRGTLQFTHRPRFYFDFVEH